LFVKLHYQLDKDSSVRRRRPIPDKDSTALLA
jgi:hypothetical protein